MNETRFAVPFRYKYEVEMNTGEKWVKVASTAWQFPVVAFMVSMRYLQVLNSVRSEGKQFPVVNVEDPKSVEDFCMKMINSVWPEYSDGVILAIAPMHFDLEVIYAHKDLPKTKGFGSDYPKWLMTHRCSGCKCPVEHNTFYERVLVEDRMNDMFTICKEEVVCATCVDKRVKGKTVGEMLGQDLEFPNKEEFLKSMQERYKELADMKVSVFEHEYKGGKPQEIDFEVKPTVIIDNLSIKKIE